VIQVARGISSVQVPSSKPDSPRPEGNRIAENGKLEPIHDDSRQWLRCSVGKAPNERYTREYDSNEHDYKINAISAPNQLNAQHGKRQRQVVNG
jgi:hypothetical protein